MMYATEQVANPWGQYVNQMNRMAGLPEEKRIYRKPDFRLMIQQNDLGQSVPIAYTMDFIDSKFDYNKAANELSEKQTKIRTQKKACGGPLPKKSKFKRTKPSPQTQTRLLQCDSKRVNQTFTRKSKMIEGILCQTRNGARSILVVCEELRYRRAVQNSPIKLLFPENRK
jgi:hypothetical protein